MRIQLSEHFGYRKLLRFVLPSIIMMIFTSIYSVVDGLFVSNFAGKTPFAAINLIYPLLIILGALGFMVGTGGTALVAKTLGEGNHPLANRYFSLLAYVTAIGGIMFALLAEIFLVPIAQLLRAEGQLLEDAVLYARIILVALPFFLLQNMFQSFFIAAEKSKLGLTVMVLAGMTNIVLDALFIIGFHWGLAGAAIATAISQMVGGVIPIIYFARPNDSLLRLGETKFDGRALVQTCFNGSSEMMSNISASIVTMLYNFQLLRFAGEDGVAAYGVIGYINFIFQAIFLGYAIGSAPLISFNFGSGNQKELQNLFRKSLKFIIGTGIFLTVLIHLTATPLSWIFVGYDQELMAMTVHGFHIYGFVFLMSGVSIFGSAFFTALNNGPVSAAIAFFRTLVFECLAVMILPLFFGIDGVWGSVLVAEFMAIVVTICFLWRQNARYHYLY